MCDSYLEVVTGRVPKVKTSLRMIGIILCIIYCKLLSLSLRLLAPKVGRTVHVVQLLGTALVSGSGGELSRVLLVVVVD